MDIERYASKEDNSLGRVYPEKEHPYRGIYQRDRDRIIHSKAFRRLEYKTQVFVNHEDGNYRTRLTHTLEVMQIARTIARALGLNEDLTEAISLAHDIGHPPFGHTGELVVNELMKENGGFEHNLQGLRIVDELEMLYRHFKGLNLTFEVREGILKYKPQRVVEIPESFKKFASPTIEAQVVDQADEIAYLSHDIDDGLTSGLLKLEKLLEIPIFSEIFIKLRSSLDEASELISIKGTIRKLINALVTDLIENSKQIILKSKVKSIGDVRSLNHYLVKLSPSIHAKDKELKEFLMVNLYKHHRVLRMAKKAERILKCLFEAYKDYPQLLPLEVQKNMKKGGGLRVIADYLSSMTDRFVIEEYTKLFDPFEKVEVL